MTLDGSTIREVAGPATGNAANQSLAEATLPPGGATTEHQHRTSEEIYLFTHGSGPHAARRGGARGGPGDAVVIPPGVPHKIWNTGPDPLRLLCACAPAYSDEDTVLTRAV